MRGTGGCISWTFRPPLKGPSPTAPDRAHLRVFRPVFHLLEHAHTGMVRREMPGEKGVNAGDSQRLSCSVRIYVPAPAIGED